MEKGEERAITEQMLRNVRRWGLVMMVTHPQKKAMSLGRGQDDIDAEIHEYNTVS